MTNNIEQEAATANVPSRKRAAIINIATNYASIGLVVIQGILLVPIYLHKIDSRVYGAWLATGSIVGYLGLLDFGFNSLVTQKVAHSAGQQDYQRLGGLVGTSLWTIVFLATIPFFIGFLMYPYISSWVGLDGTEATQINRSFLIASISTSLMFVAYGVGGIIVGLQRLEVVSIQFIVASIISILMTLLFIYLDFGIISIALGLLIRSIMLCAGHTFYL